MTLRPRDAPDWSENHHRGPAKCRSIPPPTRGDDVFFDRQNRALDICNGRDDGVICPRRTECLRAAMYNAEPYGVWGGMTARDRLRLRLRYPGMPERWTWRPVKFLDLEPEQQLCRRAS